MPRRRRVPKREILPDPKYHSQLAAKFINNIMRRGKKSVAESIFYTALELIESKVKANGLEVFQKAIENVRPLLEVKSRRVGGATYQVPVEVPTDRSIALAMRWLINSAKARSEKTMAEKLANEIIAASKKEGAAIKKREDTHRMAEANKAFAHFRW
ncbi:30S ribosomal protein S7 [candidate division KSB1 bacterium]|nr:30S ribosomal protein S7 [bacterium]OQX59113.1 MAG: 30S ribosomal protein S7 [candidate division KSB1 bacterium 4484_219]RKY79645.1 MAG: 30S ribosomal protein S7 [candidate division KSB1 bacterium]HDI52454.1 30S ribosomal protein S7 [Bacteroidota bacterium]RKY80329.1 MAG: 30S ribosomal protein S7 [candidate division KSB1 bacterium]